MNSKIIQLSNYVPVLKWRLGEYQALYRLNNSVKDGIIPLIIIPPIEYDFDEQRMKKSAHEHIEPFPQKYFNKWGNRKALIDIHESLDGQNMNNNTSIIDHIFKRLSDLECNAIPVMSFIKSKQYQGDIKKILKRDQKGIAFRLSLDDLMNPNLNTLLDSTFKFLKIKHNHVDLVLDIGRPQSFEPYSAFSNALSFKIKNISNIDTYRSFIFTGSSLQLSTVSRPGGTIQRHEWLLYKQLTTDLKNVCRIPSFGDYTIDTPDFSNLDFRLMTPAGKIVYTVDNIWFITKGRAFRGNEEQMIKHCQSIIDSEYYSGKKYSHGDRRIEDTAKETANTGNLSTWKQVGVSHHLTMIVDQLSSFHDTKTVS